MIFNKYTEVFVSVYKYSLGNDIQEKKTQYGNVNDGRSVSKNTGGNVSYK